MAPRSEDVETANTRPTVAQPCQYGTNCDTKRTGAEDPGPNSVGYNMCQPKCHCCSHRNHENPDWRQKSYNADVLDSIGRRVCRQPTAKDGRDNTALQQGE